MAKNHISDGEGSTLCAFLTSKTVYAGPRSRYSEDDEPHTYPLGSVIATTAFFPVGLCRTCVRTARARGIVVKGGR
jgi:sulfur relay (sulfurtransferase) complex TusBCD TusD component (DsrE family)